MPLSFISTLILAASLVLPPSLAQGDNVKIQAVKFTGFEQCSDTQQKQIQEAFDDAIDISNYVYNKVNFLGQAEAEYFGPAYYLSSDSQNNIKKVLTQVSSYDRPYWWNPFGKKIHIRCDDWLTLPGRGPGDPKFCTGKAAYTTNPENPATKDGLPAINFCPNFFNKLKDCQSKLNQWKNSPVDTNRLHLVNYQCQGGAFLHELFHIDTVSGVGTQGHINDLRFTIYDPDIANKRTIDAYYPLYTKILARYPDNTVGKYTTTNADNYAQYSLAKYVQSQLPKNQYPLYPIADNHPLGKPWTRNQLFSFENGVLTADNFTALQEFAAGPITPDLNATYSNCDDADVNSSDWCDTDPPVTLTSFSNYTTDLYATNAPADQTTWQNVDSPSSASLPPDNQGCFVSNLDSTGQPNADRSTYVTNIGTFCSHNNGFALPNNQSTNMTFPVANQNGWNMYVGIAWNEGDPTCVNNDKFTISQNACQSSLQSAVDNCDTGSTSQKYGGYVVNNCMFYAAGVDGPTSTSAPAPPPAAPTPVNDCSFVDNALFLSFTVDILDDKDIDTTCGAGFLDNLRGRCGQGITAWGCNYTSGKSARLTFNTPTTCSTNDVEDAINAASQGQNLKLTCNVLPSVVKASPTGS